ncbi:hypothetical protein [Treponema phagedenis]|uniref:hypothetical protein n=1 Tax=Treponema phagedenis TaxID=162 RepID=UPI0001F63832|nr:hypothetical protein [Treponema phagedenis]EFW36667.1 hypothetical protein HMPREF9554_02782 [Treponema phagedenis F0421]
MELQKTLIQENKTGCATRGEELRMMPMGLSTFVSSVGRSRTVREGEDARFFKMFA